MSLNYRKQTLLIQIPYLTNSRMLCDSLSTLKGKSQSSGISCYLTRLFMWQRAWTHLLSMHCCSSQLPCAEGERGHTAPAKYSSCFISLFAFTYVLPHFQMGRNQLSVRSCPKKGNNTCCSLPSHCQARLPPAFNYHHPNYSERQTQNHYAFQQGCGRAPINI